jgi:glycosyltransferase involved in cell wall biosynthesis
VSGSDESPRVTVIIATYNWATVLPYSIGSVLDQTFTDFELLVVGDACTDESADVVGAIATADARVHWHNLPLNGGHQAGPNNEGIRRARGALIAYLGHDDLWLPRHLEAMIAAVEGGAAIAVSNALLVGADGVGRIGPTPNASWRPGAWIRPTTMVHARSLALAVGGWRMPQATGDVDPEADLLQRMASAAGEPTWLPRLTAVKLSAAKRENVYRNRPCHEQAEWLDRIRAAEDPEAELLALASASGRARPQGSRRGVRHIVRAARRRFRPAPERPKATAEERWRANRRFKGLDESE